MQDWGSRLADEFALPAVEGADKVCSPAEAIGRHVKAGMRIHIGCTHGRPFGLMFELARRFWGQDPCFELISLGFTGPMAVLVHGGLARKCVSTFFGDAYPTPGPNPVYQKAWQSGVTTFEHWSILTLPLRLKAAAMNLGGLPTRSLIGSTMARDNAESFRVVEDPFEQGRSLGVVKALFPDVALLHGWVADRNGNALFTPPYGEGFYGAMASRQGLILSVEKIVSTEFIRRNSHLVKVPGHLVRCVSEIPLGSHPSGLTNQGIPEMQAYADDYDFLEEVRRACRDPLALDTWVRKWVLHPRTQQAYLAALGKDRIGFLKGKADRDSWVAEFLEVSQQGIPEEKANPVERMVLGAARKMAAIVESRGYRTILAGVGAANLAAWLAYRLLRERGCEVEVMAEIGFYGYTPRPADPFIFNFRNLPTCKMLSDIETIMGHLVAGVQHRNLGAIGAGQIDRWGNVNSTAVPGGTLLVGSGGANDVASGSNETIVVLNQERARFLEDVPYVTSPGDRVRTVVSDQGVFEKGEGREELLLTAVLADVDREEAETQVRGIRAQCGWELKVREPLEIMPPPDRHLLLLLRCFDPRGQFLGKNRS